MHKRSRRHLRRCLITGMLAVMAAASAQAPISEQWKWRDKAGHITVSDRPPPKEIPDADILGRPEPRNPIAAAGPASAALAPAPPASTALEREVEARERSARQSQAAKAKAEEIRVAAERAENCRRARSAAMALESGQRMARINDNGEREVLDDKGRAEELRAAREAMASDCR